MSYSINRLLVTTSLLCFAPVLASAIDHNGGLDVFPMNSEDKQLISKLSPVELARLNEQLHQAMMLYYNDAYGRALPLLRELAAKVGTSEILYWYGMAAYRSGRLDLAISKFQPLLEQHPDLHRVRLELAAIFLTRGDKKSAAAEVAKVLAGNPPQALAAAALNMQRGIENLAQTTHKRDFLTLNLTTSWQNDSNINAVSDDRIHGSITSVARDASMGHSVAGSVDFLHDFGQPGQWVWRNLLGVYSLDYWDHGANDYAQVDFSTSMEHLGKSLNFKLPVGIVSSRYAHEPLSNSWYLAPEVIFPKLYKNGFLKVGYRLSDETFSATSSRTQDNQLHTLTLTPNLQLESFGKGLISLTNTFSRADADAAQYSYKEWGIGPSWSTPLGLWDLGAVVQGVYRYRQYDGNVVSIADFTPPDRRLDQKYGLTAMLNRTFLGKYTVSTTYAYTRNDSNTSLYDYSKYVFSVNLGGNLNF